ncbi:hypothetical protein [Pedobacter sp. Hv1]|uniref:hypothetical protein n=1 Tax=Pedobacter sp. Hv1 TaxID=1740090 RepID=UPI0006D8B11F|nr:hypothetical protein [Pedobacter sp. Hv1]KQB99071.1 hypothetical protein AQF98_19150 [Pedobacter sp. Hv1]
MRKILAILCTLITLYALKETVVIFISKDTEVIAKREILIVIALSITVPLAILSLWLWKPKHTKVENHQ